MRSRHWLAHEMAVTLLGFDTEVRIRSGWKGAEAKSEASLATLNRVKLETLYDDSS